MRLPILAVALSTLATPILAQDCSQLCSSNFWETATSEQVENALKGADVNLSGVSPEWEYNTTPLIEAAMFGSPEAIAALIGAGANIEGPDEYGTRPLQSAAAASAVANVSALLAAGAELEARGADDWTALHYAASSGSAETVSVLLAEGADATAVSTFGRTPYEVAQDMNEAALAAPLLALLVAGAPAHVTEAASAPTQAAAPAQESPSK